MRLSDIPKERKIHFQWSAIESAFIWYYKKTAARHMAVAIKHFDRMRYRLRKGDIEMMRDCEQMMFVRMLDWAASEYLRQEKLDEFY